jgi:two-component sensor histidine kinase
MVRIRSITGHLLFYALALSLPILIMSGLIAWGYLRQEERRIDRLSETQIANATSEIESRLATFRATLTTLSVSPSVLNADVEDIRSRLERIGVVGGVWFTLRDRNGRQLLNTRKPPGAPLPAFRGQGDSIIFDEGKPYVSNLIRARVAESWAITLSVPVRASPESSEVRYALTAVIPVSYMREILTRAPPGWIVTINDRAGKIVARSLAHEQWVGKPMSETVQNSTKDVPPGGGGIWTDVYTLEGTRVRGAYWRMVSTGWLIGVAALPEVYEAPKRSILLLGIALAALCLLTATILAFFMGRRITRAIEALQVKAFAMRDMRVIDVPRTSVDEVNTVAEIMRKTAVALRARQEQQTTLIQELNHRVKNTLATVQAISRMTLKNAKDLPSFDQTFSSRLLALSVTHDLLTESAWSGVELQDLLEKELKPFQVGSRVVMNGPKINLTSKIAVALGMAIHEMGTNAAKYGALRGDSGEIRISWSVAGDVLRFEWSERTDQPIMPPGRTGFGTQLIHQTIARDLEGSVNLTYASDGLRAIFLIPLGAHDRIEPSAG